MASGSFLEALKPGGQNRYSVCITGRVVAPPPHQTTESVLPALAPYGAVQDLLSSVMVTALAGFPVMLAEGFMLVKDM